MSLEVKPRLIYRDGKPVGVQGIARDITGREEAEMELRHAQKLESVGRLASGIAHEINTPIQFVGDNTRFLQDSFVELADPPRTSTRNSAMPRARAFPDPTCWRKWAQGRGSIRLRLLAGGDSQGAHANARRRDAGGHHRARHEGIRSPGRQGNGRRRPQQGALSTLTVARNELKYVADVETDFGDLPPVVCNVGDMNQVFLNLLVNAAHCHRRRGERDREERQDPSAHSARRRRWL